MDRSQFHDELESLCDKARTAATADWLVDGSLSEDVFEKAFQDFINKWSPKE